MFAANLDEIACDTQMTRTALRVLLLCVAHVTEEGRVLRSQREMAQALGTDTSAVSKAVKGLVRLGFLFQSGHQLWLNSRVGTNAEDDLAILKLRRREVPLLQALDSQLDTEEVTDEVEEE